MNRTLFINNIKSGFGIFLFVTGMLLIYVSISVSMFNPESAKAMEAMFEMLPESMIRGFGFTDLGTDLTSYLGGYLYGFILLIFPLIYTSVMALKLVIKHVDSGSMAYLLTTPNSRVRIVLTQAIYLVCSTVVLFAFQITILISLAQIFFYGKLNMGKFLALNLITLLVILFVSGITFLCSCAFNNMKYALSIGVGLPIVMFVLKMVREIDESVEFLKYFSIYSLVDKTKIFNDSAYVILVGLSLFVGSVILYSIGIYVFNKKSLTI